MAAASCSSVRCSPSSGTLPLPSASTNLLHSRSRCSSGAFPSVSVCESGASRDFSVSSNGTKTHSVWPRVSAGDFSASAPGATFDQDAASSSSCRGSGGSSFLYGDCGHPNARTPPWNFRVLVSSSRRRSGRRHGNGHGDVHQCRAIRSRAQEEAAVVREVADLSESLLTLKGVVSSEYRAIGPEMRGRVERLYDRVVGLQQSADRAINSGSRIPTQLTANLIALQREHGSLENIVRLAMEASPALESLEAAVSGFNTLSDTASNLLLEEAKPTASIFQTLVRESALKPVKSASPKYVMSVPASQGSSPLATFRAEIESRVIKQLAGKKMNKSPSPGSLVSDSSQPSSKSSAAYGVSQFSADEKSSVETFEALEQGNGQLSGLSAEKAAGTVTMLEDKLKKLELDLAKSLPLHLYEQKVGTINAALSDARAEVVQLTAEVTEKETILAAVKKHMLAEQEQLMQKVRELTGDLEKKFSVDDMEAAVNFGLQDLEKELEEEQDRTFLLTIELEKKEKFIVEQQESWRIMKEEMEQKLEEQLNRALSLSIELETKEKLMIEQEEAWKVEKMALEADFKSIKVKLQDVRKKRTKERAQLAEKKQKVKFLEQELVRLQETMEEADRIRLEKKESMYATARGLITQMVQSSRARADSEAQASILAQEVAKLQKENQVLENSARAAEEKAGQAEIEITGVKASLTKVGSEVANLQGELPLGERAAALDKFFGVMAQLINQESDNMEVSPETNYAPDNELREDDELQMSPEDRLPSAADDWEEDMGGQADLQTETSKK